MGAVRCGRYTGGRSGARGGGLGEDVLMRANGQE